MRGVHTNLGRGLIEGGALLQHCRDLPDGVPPGKAGAIGVPGLILGQPGLDGSRVRGQPDEDAVFPEGRHIVRVQDDAAAGGQNLPPGVPVTGHQLLFQPSELAPAALCHDVSDGPAGLPDQHLVQIHKRAVQRLRQPGPHGSLAGAPVADEDQVGIVIGMKVHHGYAAALLLENTNNGKWLPLVY